MTTEQSPLSEARLQAIEADGDYAMQHELPAWNTAPITKREVTQMATELLAARAEVRRFRTGGTTEGQTAPMAWIEYAGPVPIAEITEGTVSLPPTPIPAAEPAGEAMQDGIQYTALAMDETISDERLDWLSRHASRTNVTTAEIRLAATEAWQLRMSQRLRATLLAAEPAETPVVTEALEAAKLVFEGVYGHGKRRMVDIHAETYEKIKAALAFSKGAQQK